MVAICSQESSALTILASADYTGATHVRGHRDTEPVVRNHKRPAASGRVPRRECDGRREGDGAAAVARGNGKRALGARLVELRRDRLGLSWQGTGLIAFEQREDLCTPALPVLLRLYCSAVVEEERVREFGVAETGEGRRSSA